jgi:hypothetical protein
VLVDDQTADVVILRMGEEIDAGEVGQHRESVAAWNNPRRSSGALRCLT